MGFSGPLVTLLQFNIPINCHTTIQSQAAIVKFRKVF